MQSSPVMSRAELVRLTILSAILGLLIAQTIYTFYLHPWLERIGACRCGHEEEITCQP